MHPATSWQVAEHCKEMVVQITTILSYSCSPILKIMSLNKMRLVTSHQSAVLPKYVPYKYLLYYLIYADLDIGFYEPIQHAS